MKKYELVIIAFFLAFIPSAHSQQYKNTIKLETGGFVVPGANNPQPGLLEQHGLYYERKLSRKVQLSCGLSWWNSYFGDGYYLGAIPKVITTKRSSTDNVTLTRSNYKMVDIAARYSLIATKRHALKAGLGLSFAKGHDTYFDIKIPPPLPPGWYWYDAEIYTYQHSDIHLGVVSSMSYDYHILNGRFALGADVKCRKYFSLQSVQIDYGVHVSCNF